MSKPSAADNYHPQSEQRTLSKPDARILLVEDDDVAVMITKTLLANMNCKVDVATSGHQALQMARRDARYDVIFTDVGLPDLNGYEVTRQIRLQQLSNDKHVPIIGLTAHISEENKQQCIDAGMNLVVTKPLTEQDAQAILTQFVAHPEQDGLHDSPSSVTDELVGEAINFEAATAQVGGDAATARKLLTMLVKSLPEDINQLRVAYNAGKRDNIMAIVHKLKGSASYCGTERLKDICTRLKVAYQQDYEFDICYHKLLDEIEAVINMAKQQGIG